MTKKTRIPDWLRTRELISPTIAKTERCEFIMGMLRCRRLDTKQYVIENKKVVWLCFRHRPHGQRIYKDSLYLRNKAKAARLAEQAQTTPEEES